VSAPRTTAAPEVAPAIAVVARLAELTPEQEARLLDRGRATDPDVQRAVAAVVDDVRSRGDAALHELARRYDGVELATLEVPRERWGPALAALPAAVREGLELAAESIARFHRAQLPVALEVEVRPGVRVGRRPEPLARVGVYAPGGRAAYPSSVLMGVVPARVAGVGEVIVCSPPGPQGAPPGPVLAACALAGADRLFALGGAGAVAAMALGTASVPRVDKVVGPGNAYVTEAKRQLASRVAVDAPAGPSEVLVVADGSAAPELVAAELLAQAEHDPDAAAVLVSTDPELPARVLAALARLLPAQPRREIIEAALAARGGLLLAGSLLEALVFAARYAPEHLALLVADPRGALAAVRCAGTVVLGASSSVVFGDYLTGANHVLPTAGLARGASGLSTGDFLRWTSWQEVSPAAGAELAPVTAALAGAEGLPAHALAASLRASAPGRSAADGAGAASIPPSAVDAREPLPAPATRFGYRELTRYDPGRTPCEVDLSDNTNLAGPPPAAARLLERFASAAVTRYPTPYATDLRGALAHLAGVDAACVTTGCGSDDLIDAALRAFIEPGSGARVAFPVPTFGILPAFAGANGAAVAPVPLLPDLGLDAEALVATGATVTYVCRPNNPTGTLFAREAVERVAASSRGLVLVDEAYADFAGDGEDLRRWAAASRNVVVLRTLSKAWGLAGLRVGYAVGPPALVAEIDKARGPYKVGGVAEAAVLAALAHDAAWCRAAVLDVIAHRARLAAALRERGLSPLPSEANFLFVPLDAARGGAPAIAAALRARGVAVRPFAGLPVVGGGIRVGVGPWPLMERFLAALDAVLGAATAAEA
jgi:histidinol dehydrogenase